jgi:hypothetical protein
MTYNSEEEEVEPKTTKPIVFQSIEPTGIKINSISIMTNFSSKLLQEGLFEVFKPTQLTIPIDVPTRAHYKCTMKHKRKEVMEDNGFPTKVTWKQAPVEGKEI